MNNSDIVQESVFGDIRGNKPYEQRARLALPILVRQAKAQSTIFYSELAAELGMSNPRNLNYVLGLIGKEMLKLEVNFGERPPPIQCCVVSKSTGLPGEGIGWFVPSAANFQRLSSGRKRELMNQMLNEVYAYTRWDEVLAKFGLAPTQPYTLAELRKKFSSSGGGGNGGEGPLHKALKENIAGDPSLVGLKEKFEIVETEYGILSGDIIDISCKGKNIWVGIEVKGKNSSDGDLIRGIFQCVKYAAVMEAENAVDDNRLRTSVILALGGTLPNELVAIKNMLGVSVIDGLQP